MSRKSIGPAVAIIADPEHHLRHLHRASPMSFVIGALFIRETKDRDIQQI